MINGFRLVVTPTDNQNDTMINNFTYTFNAKGLIKTIIVNNVQKIKIDYTCD